MEREVVENILLFYNTNSNDERKKAEEILNTFKNSEKSWQICCSLLNQEIPQISGKDSNSIHLFIATTLSNKIKFHSNDLKAESKKKIKDFLLEKILNFDQQKSDTILRQLCTALANFVVVSSEWTNSIPFLATFFSERNPKILLKILTYVVEEYNSLKQRHRFVISKEKLAQFEDNCLNKIANDIIKLFDQLLEKNKDDIKSELPRCIAVWLDVIDPFHFSSNTLCESKTVEFLMESLFQNTQNFDVLIDALTSVFCYMNEEKYKKNVNFFKKLVVFIGKIKTDIIDVLASKTEIDFEVGSKCEKISNLIQIICSSVTDLILELEPNSLAILRISIELLDIKHRPSNCIIAGYLITFFEELDSVYKSCDDSSQKAVLENIIIETVKKLVQKSCVSENDVEDEENDFSEFRLNVKF
ncbi:hypothetical protein MHBO_000934 [Bonamia ostreae]|uniref:Importin N-terminal domain-containing protein n=1 Tax=Bonamia ostreae TaxID=126728 RepID=A0ABV2AHH8_9EUKA